MPVGKLVRGALYVHCDAIGALTKEARTKMDEAVAIAGSTRWNVVRIENEVVGLLEYEDIDDAAFPRLFASTRVNLSTRHYTRTDYSRSTNPLILHRKEQLLIPQDPRVGRWAKRTQMLVELGLFKDNHAIGRLGCWTQRLAEAGLNAVGDEVIQA